MHKYPKHTNTQARKHALALNETRTQIRAQQDNMLHSHKQTHTYTLACTHPHACAHSHTHKYTHKHTLIHTHHTNTCTHSTHKHRSTHNTSAHTYNTTQKTRCAGSHLEASPAAITAAAAARVSGFGSHATHCRATSSGEGFATAADAILRAETAAPIVHTWHSSPQRNAHTCTQLHSQNGRPANAAGAPAGCHTRTNMRQRPAANTDIACEFAACATTTRTESNHWSR